MVAGVLAGSAHPVADVPEVHWTHSSDRMNCRAYWCSSIRVEPADGTRASFELDSRMSEVEGTIIG